MSMSLEELLALLPDNATGAIDAADLRVIVTELYAMAAEMGQAFSYLWTTQAAPASGRVRIPAWVTGPATLAVSEVSNDGETVPFGLLDPTDQARVILTTPDGGRMDATVTGVPTDQGTYREVPVTVVSATGPAPTNNMRATLTAVVTP